MAHPEHQSVRERYGYRCGYCGVSEIDTGGELTVDHYHPVSAGGDDSDENLVYGCIRCNLYKSDFVPSEAQKAAGKRVLHPLLDNVALHYRENISTGELEPLTETGKFHIELLNLNRVQLIAHRKEKWIRSFAESILQFAQAEATVDRTEIEALQRYVAYLERELKLRPH
jgi:hypothetical protein